MRALHVINGLGTGGAERSLAELVPALAARGIESTIVCLHHRTEGVERDVVASGVDVRFVGAASLAGRVGAIRRVIRDTRPDVVHTTIFESDVAGRVATIGTGVPVVTSLVNTSYRGIRRADAKVPAWKLEAVRRVERWSGRLRNRGFIAISDDVARAAVDDLGYRRDRIVVVPRGRDPRRMIAADADGRRAARDELGIDGDVPVLLHVGRHEYQKAIDVLVEALAVVRATHPDVVLLQAGRAGSADDAIEAAVRHADVADAVRFLGHRDDVPRLLAAADVFVFPSRYEGLGGSLVEAHAAARAVVCTDLPAAREVVVVGETGDVVPVDDARALAAAVTALLDDPERRARYGRAGRARFEEHFTLDGVADRFAGALRRFADS